jgi:exonuclease III
MSTEYILREKSRAHKISPPQKHRHPLPSRSNNGGFPEHNKLHNSLKHRYRRKGDRNNCQRCIRTNITRIPTGRGMAVTFNGTTIINLHAPTGAENKRARENFFNKDIIPLLDTQCTPNIIAGDFNCVIDKQDSTGQLSTCRALKQLIKEIRLQDIWTKPQTTNIYTHYTARGASRIDRIYILRTI